MNHVCKHLLTPFLGKKEILSLRLVSKVFYDNIDLPICPIQAAIIKNEQVDFTNISDEVSGKNIICCSIYFDRWHHLKKFIQTSKCRPIDIMAYMSYVKYGCGKIPYAYFNEKSMVVNITQYALMPLVYLPIHFHDAQISYPFTIIDDIHCLQTISIDKFRDVMWYLLSFDKQTIGSKIQELYKTLIVHKQYEHIKILHSINCDSIQTVISNALFVCIRKNRLLFDIPMLIKLNNYTDLKQLPNYYKWLLLLGAPNISLMNEIKQLLKLNNCPKYKFYYSDPSYRKCITDFDISAWENPKEILHWLLTTFKLQIDEVINLMPHTCSILLMALRTQDINIVKQVTETMIELGADAMELRKPVLTLINSILSDKQSYIHYSLQGMCNRVFTPEWLEILSIYFNKYNSDTYKQNVLIALDNSPFRQ